MWEAGARADTKLSLVCGCEVGGVTRERVRHGRSSGSIGGGGNREGKQRGCHKASMPSTGLPSRSILTALKEGRKGKCGGGLGIGRSLDGACGFPPRTKLGMAKIGLRPGGGHGCRLKEGGGGFGKWTLVTGPMYGHHCQPFFFLVCYTLSDF